jgi:hypothetical protein
MQLGVQPDVLVGILGRSTTISLVGYHMCKVDDTHQNELATFTDH